MVQCLHIVSEHINTCYLRPVGQLAGFTTSLITPYITWNTQFSYINNMMNTFPVRLEMDWTTEGIWREISLNNGDKCVWHDLQIKSRFINVYDGVHEYIVHKQIPNNLNKCKTITSKYITTWLNISILHVQYIQLQVHRSDQMCFWKASCAYKHVKIINIRKN